MPSVGQSGRRQDDSLPTVSPRAKSPDGGHGAIANSGAEGTAAPLPTYRLADSPFTLRNSLKHAG
ncbi:hypothetical protein BRAO375_830028 [Bradyrhizobium sp. ORS 375]|nr:hypothetical protein BRAO375_830028 [Bradyrhizobium sp. ORS 375]